MPRLSLTIFLPECAANRREPEGSLGAVEEGGPAVRAIL